MGKLERVGDRDSNIKLEDEYLNTNRQNRTREGRFVEKWGLNALRNVILNEEITPSRSWDAIGTRWNCQLELIKS